MSGTGSVTELVSRLKAGDVAAARQLWHVISSRLLGLARKKLPRGALGVGNEEDVVQSALASFFHGLEGGKFPRLHDRNDLWHLLAVITARKVFDFRKREGRQNPHPANGEPDLDQTADPKATSSLDALLNGECQRLLDRLGDAQLRSI